jgi:hypothetical protein
LTSVGEMKTNMSRCDHAVKSFSEPSFEDRSGDRDEQAESEDISDHARSEQQDSGGKDEQAIDHLFGGKEPAGKSLSNLPKGSDPLSTNEESAKKGRTDDQQNGIECAEVPADSNQDVELYYGDKCEKEKEATHDDLSLACAHPPVKAAMKKYPGESLARAAPVHPRGEVRGG